MNERIKDVRSFFHLNQSDFGEKIGVSRDTVANIECGRIEIKDLFIKSICREFNVDYLWLTTGDGEMFVDNDNDLMELIDRIMVGDSEFHRNIFKTFAKLDTLELAALESILDKYIEIKKGG